MSLTIENQGILDIPLAGILVANIIQDFYKQT